MCRAKRIAIDRTKMATTQGCNMCCSGRGLWLDKQQRYCLVLWKTIEEWAGVVSDWAAGSGMADEVVTLDELSRGDEVRGTGARGEGRRCMLWCSSA